MKKTSKVKGILEILLVIGLILLIPLFFVIRTAANQPPAKKTPVPPMPTALATLENAGTKGKEPPACTFPLAEITTQESTLEEYTFSEPQVMLTAPQGNIYNIAEWLPDNQQVLMTEDLRNVENGNQNPPQQSISLYNPETGESKVYATRLSRLDQEPPSWQAELNAVVYPVMNFLGTDKNNHLAKFTRQVWVSYGDPDKVQILADYLPQFPIAIKPDGSETIYLSDKQASKLDESLKKLPSIPFDSAQWDYGKGRRGKDPVSYNMAWQPTTPLIFLYSNGGISKMGGYTFILDTNTGQVCELNLGGWAIRAHWSSDGRYLAVIRAAEYSFPIHTSDLTILDMATGSLSTIAAIPQDMTGEHYIDDFTWAPDNRHLLVLEDIPSTYDTNQIETIHHELFLVDFKSSEDFHLFPEFKSFVADGVPWNNFAWSPDGSKLLIRCPANGVDRICFIAVQRIGQ